MIIPLSEVIEQMPAYAEFLKEVVTGVVPLDWLHC
jgi:hypothetical protein